MPPVLYTLDPSPPSRAVYMTAKAVGIKLDHKVVNLFKEEQFEPDFIKLNPKHTVPTLIDGDLILTDSHAITTYLIGKYGQDESLYPKNVAKRALVDQMMYFDSGIAFPSLLHIVDPLKSKLTKEISEDKVIKAHETYAFLEKYLDGRNWVALDHCTIADIHLTATITGLVFLVPLENNYSNIDGWLERCKKMDWYSENVKGQQDFMDIFHSLLNS